MIKMSDNLKPIKHIEVKKEMKVSELVEQMRDAGFQAKKISEASEILHKVIRDKDCKLFLGVAGAMVPAGMKQIIIEILQTGRIAAFVTTGANLTHDLIEALGHSHYPGNEKADDAQLHEKGIDRIYNVFMKNEVYPELEKFFEKIFPELQRKKQMSIKEFLWEIGKHIDVKTESSILRVCYENKIPIFCPAISDSGVGLMIWGRNLGKKEDEQIKVDTFSDLNEILDIAWQAEKSAVFYIGGGVPKNFVQQAMQFSKKGGASYGIQITTDREESGGSSGAPLREGISWGKLSEKADFVNVFCDATIALPLIWASVKERLS